MFNRNEITSDEATPSGPARKPWWDLEENFPHGGVWQIPKVLDRPRFITATAELMCNPDRFAEAMRRALREWPKSVEAAMSTPGLNRRAWIGHAGCFLAAGSPEETTRLQLRVPVRRAARVRARVRRLTALLPRPEPMTVWVVVEEFWDKSEILGVYGSRKSAEAARDAADGPRTLTSRWMYLYSVTEWTVQGSNR